MTTDRYMQLDLAEAGSIAENLFARLERESRQPSLTLTGDGDPGSISGNLTPEMNAWAAAQIAAARQSALTTLEGAAGRIRLDGGVEGIVQEIEDDKLRRRRNIERSGEINSFYDTHRERLDAIADLELEFRRLRVHEGLREAKVPNRWVRFGVPVLVAIPEFFMNYTSFLKLADVLAIAIGLAVVVAVAVAVSADMTGRFWKAYHYFMHPNDDVQRAKGIRMISIASFLFTVAMCAVAYARYQTVNAQRIATEILGLDPPNVIAATGGLLAGNVLVFAIGAAITFLVNDENPDYAAKAEEYRGKKEELEALRNRGLTERLRGIEAGYDKDRRQMLKRARLMDVQPDYGAIRDGMGHVSAKDEEVIGLLQGYRSRLVDAIAKREPAFCFSANSTERQVGSVVQRVTLAEFAALPINLYFWGR